MKIAIGYETKSHELIFTLDTEKNEYSPVHFGKDDCGFFLKLWWLEIDFVKGLESIDRGEDM